MDPAQLTHIERLCEALYNGTSQEARAEAQEQLLTLQSSAEFIPQCQFILDNTTQPYAQLLASSSLESLITQFWNNFTSDQKLEIRNYILSFLNSNAHTLMDFVVGGLSKLACRITKLGWFDHTDHREIVKEVMVFLQGSVDQHIVGLRVLMNLVEEMNIPTSGRTMTHHRKTAVSFRDNALFPVFQLSITTLQHLQAGDFSMTDAQTKKMTTNALSVTTACLSFDFIGTNPEESPEDVGTVQVPSSWRSIVQDATHMQLLFEFYLNTVPPMSNLALESIVQLASVRRSLFAVEKERTDFLNHLMKHVHSIMLEKKGLEHVENYHEFCRLLGRLKASYQLSELVRTPGFSDWLGLAVDFTVKSLENWEMSMNSIHYLLALWARLVSALPYLKPEANDGQVFSQFLRQCVMQVVQAYIDIMLSSVDAVVESDGGIEDPLDDEGSLKEQMDRFPVLARLQFDTVAQYLVTQYEEIIGQYQSVLGSLQGRASDQVAAQISVMEGRLTWLTHMIAAIIGSPSHSDSRKAGDDQVWDGQMSRYVFQLVQLVDYRLENSQGQAKCDIKLESAILTFFTSFKKVYLMDNFTRDNMVPINIGSTLPGGSMAHPMLAAALSGLEPPPQENVTIYDTMGLGDVNAIMNIVVIKICNNIRYWHRANELLDATLQVFVDLIAGYSSSKALLNLETVNFMVHNHVGAHFPFLGYDSDNKYRISFYTALTRLVFTAAEDINNEFDDFLTPVLEIIEQLNQTEDLSEASVKVALVGLFRDLRGITQATTTKRTYNLLFDAVFPACFELLKRATEFNYNDPHVMTALLKFLMEFVYNKGVRVAFDQSSANGILLFRETSEVLCSYGSRVLSLPVEQDIYVEKYKGIRLLLNTLSFALSGNYVNFGVFALYGDKALQNSFDVSLQLCLNIPLEDVLAYVKLSKAYFQFLEILLKNHLDVLCGLDANIFIIVVRTIHEGLQSNETQICALCAASIDHIYTYIFLHQRRGKPTVQRIVEHLASDPAVGNELIATLFNSLLFSTHANHWAVTRPILSLLLANEEAFNCYQEQLVGAQPPENQSKLQQEFVKLTEEVQRSLETSNRDKFTQKLTLFRLSVRQFLSF